MRKSARRRVRTRTALFLCLAAVAGMALFSLLGRFVPPAGRVWLGAGASLVCFALPAYLGLCRIDGDQRHLLSVRRLSSAQALWLVLTGALLVCPVTLLSDVISAMIVKLYAAFGAQAVSAASGAGGAALLLPVLLASGLLAPVCEELFFRGYLMGVFGRYGSVWACAMTALTFAACHKLGSGTPGYVALGLAFGAVRLRMGSVLAPVLMHMAYNMTLTLLSATPLSALFAGLTPHGCLARLFGCAALCFTAKRAWLAYGAREGQEKNFSLTWREAALVIAALMLVLAAQVTAMLAAGGNA